MEFGDSSKGFSLDHQPDIFLSSTTSLPPAMKGGGASISLHTMLGSPNPKTMRLCGMIIQEKAMILVDSGNTQLPKLELC